MQKFLFVLMSDFPYLREELGNEPAGQAWCFREAAEQIRIDDVIKLMEKFQSSTLIHDQMIVPTIANVILKYISKWDKQVEFNMFVDELTSLKNTKNIKKFNCHIHINDNSRTEHLKENPDKFNLAILYMLDLLKVVILYPKNEHNFDAIYAARVRDLVRKSDNDMPIIEDHEIGDIALDYLKKSRS